MPVTIRPIIPNRTVVMVPPRKAPPAARGLIPQSVFYYPCDYRGEAIGKLNCGCSGKPIVYNCRHPAISNGICTVNAAAFRRREIFLPNGAVRSFEGRPQSCAICRQRFAAGDADPRSLTADDLEWIPTPTLIEDGLRLVRYVEPETAGIIGVPRSGMLPAAAVATHCHLPLYALTDRGPVDIQAGSRGFNFPRSGGRSRYLLIDDSSHNGGAMRRARQTLAAWGDRVTYAAVYVRDPRTVDAYARHLGKVHCFEWNMLNNGLVRGMAIDPRLRGEGFMFDFDGILCEEPAFRHTDAEEAAVIDWLRAVRPLRWIPRFAQLPWVVSFRLEKHRAVIQEWLDRWKIRVDRLILHPAATFAERDANFDVIEHKARRFAESDATVFVESSPDQAAAIAAFSRKPVLCPAAGGFIFG